MVKIVQGVTSRIELATSVVRVTIPATDEGLLQLPVRPGLYADLLRHVRMAGQAKLSL
jgi:hypothetical protein